MENHRKPLAPLVMGILTLLLGISAVWDGWASMYGMRIAGSHAMVFGLVCIAFSTWIFLWYFRKGKRD